MKSSMNDVNQEIGEQKKQENRREEISPAIFSRTVIELPVTSDLQHNTREGGEAHEEETHDSVGEDMLV